MTKEIQITFTGENYAFAITQDNFQQAYIPNSILVQMGDVSVGDVFQAAMVENDRDPRGRTPWFVTHVVHTRKSDRSEEVAKATKVAVTHPLLEQTEVIDENDIDLFTHAMHMPPEKHRAVHSLADRTRTAINNMEDYPFTTADVADVIKEDSKIVGSMMLFMHKQGNVACARIYKSADQVRASSVIWCKTAEGFLA